MISTTRAMLTLAYATLALGLTGAVVLSVLDDAGAAPNDLVLSEYVEGSSNNKALEVANLTSGTVTLTDAYDVQIYANGSVTPTATIPLTGTVEPGEVHVLVRSAAVPSLLATADQTTTNFLFNGDDAIVLRHAGAIIDAFGQIGFDPGSQWGSGETSTMDATLRRVSSAADVDGTNVFDPANDWLGVGIDVFDDLGSFDIQPANLPPAATDDALIVQQGGSTVFLDVLANDTDPEGGRLLITGVTAPSHGEVSIASGGTMIELRLAEEFIGTLTFSYTVSDPLGATASAAALVTIERPAPADPCDGRATHIGTPGRDLIVGTPGADVIHAGAGGDVVLARGGDDIVCAGEGPDIVLGGPGDDTIFGSDDREILLGLGGDDVIVAGGGSDRVLGGAGDDVLDGGPGRDFISGGRGNDRCIGDVIDRVVRCEP